jgi:hypothetical protein
MFGSDDSGKRALECLRLEADCRQLGIETDRPHLKVHFARMAKMWAALADSGSFDVGTGTPS